MPKYKGTVGSIVHNTKKIIARSDCNWSHIRAGSHIKIGENPHIYEITKVFNGIYTVDFEVIDPIKLLIKSDFNPYIIKEDQINIFYNQYELMALIGIRHSGEGFKENEIVIVEDGSPETSIQTFEELKTKFKVLSVSSTGSLQILGLESKGSYINPPTNEIVKVRNIEGKTALLELSYCKKIEKTSTERSVKAIERIKTEENHFCYLYLDYPLPKHLKNGTISINKWEAHLLNEYEGEDQYGVNCEIINDFTPNIKLPIILPNSSALDIILNKSFIKIDSEIDYLKKKVKELEEKLSILSK